MHRSFDKKLSLTSVRVPTELEQIFSEAEEAVSTYFRSRREVPENGSIEIFDERYILVRAASLSTEFFRQLENFFGSDRKIEAIQFARDFLFDLSHTIGKSDARNFHKKMNLSDPIQKLSAGPIHFSHSGWAKVDILQESRPVSNEDYCMIYDHLSSFESDAWQREGRISEFPVCIMSAGYSSGWCEESFGFSLVSSEIMCRARGDNTCRFIMAPPSRIEEHIKKYLGVHVRTGMNSFHYEIPEFFSRKRIEEDLRISERKYRLLFEGMSEGFALFSVICNEAGNPVDLRCVEVNPAFDRQFGMSSCDVLGKTLLELFPQIEPMWIEKIGRVGLTGTALRFEARFAPLDRWFNISAYRIETASVAVILFDTTEKKKAEESHFLYLKEQAERNAAEKALQQVKASEQRLLRSQVELQEAQDRLKALSEAAFEGIAIHEKGRILLANESLARIFGYSTSELVGKNLMELAAVDYREKVFDGIRSGIESPYESKGLRKDGSEFWGEISARNGYYNGRQVRVSAVRDITRRKETEDELKRAKEELEVRVNERTAELFQLNSFLNLVIENIPSMIFIKDAENLRFVRFNKEGEDLLGYSREELIGKTDFDLFPKSEAENAVLQDRETLVQGKVLDLPEILITTRNRGARFFRSKKVPIFDPSGKPQYLLGIAEDITEKKRAEELRLKLREEKIARAEAEKNVLLRDDFIAIVSHELRTPLTSLRLQFQMIPRLLRDVPFIGKDKFFELYQKSLRQLEQFGHLVEDLLDLSRMSSEGLVLDPKPVILSEIVARVAEQYSPELKSARCKLKTDLDPRVKGQWDPIRIEQVVVNLMTNAMKYGAGKPIEILVQLVGDDALFMIRDYGLGISRDDQTKIFERFERAAPVTKYRGLGLGLFITRQIVQAHGGTIRVESELGKGASFIVTLPLYQP